jgi:hypothetical protein
MRTEEKATHWASEPEDKLTLIYSFVMSGSYVLKYTPVETQQDNVIINYCRRISSLN